MKRSGIVKVLLLGVFLLTSNVWAEEGFTRKDRELLIELRTRMAEIDKRFEQIDKRFEQIDKRFEQIDKRFEQIDIRIAELREDMNQRFEQLTDFLYILAGIFTTLVAVVIGFAYWDRRTIIREARREAIEWMEKEGTVRRVVDALKELAREDPRIAEALRRVHLL